MFQYGLVWKHASKRVKCFTESNCFFVDTILLKKKRVSKALALLSPPFRDQYRSTLCNFSFFAWKKTRQHKKGKKTGRKQQQQQQQQALLALNLSTVSKLREVLIFQEMYPGLRRFFPSGKYLFVMAQNVMITKCSALPLCQKLYCKFSFRLPFHKNFKHENALILTFAEFPRKFQK